MGVAKYQTAVTEAKAAYKADKSNKDLKKALKAAKAALAEAEAKAAAKAAKKEKKRKAAEQSDESPAKKAKTEEAEPAAAAAEEPIVAIKKANATPAAGEGVANPTGCMKIFAGNLSFQIDDDGIKDFFKDCGTVTEIKWLEDKDTGRFKGCGFLHFDTAEAAAKAVAMNGQECMGREIRVDFSTAKPKTNKGADRFAGKPLSEKPEGCTCVFAGNLSFDIDDDTMREFAEGCGEIKAIRWLSNRDTGDFKGCGFVEFYDSESVDKFVLKNGENLMGRPIRLDYSAPRK